MSSTAIDAPPHCTSAVAALPYWSRASLPQALAALAGRDDLLSPPPPEADEAERWMVWAGGRLDQQVQEVEVPRRDLAQTLTHAGRVILWHPGAASFLVVLGRRRLGGLWMLAPDGSRQHFATAAISKAHLPRPHPSNSRQISRLAAAAALGSRATERLAEAILDRIEQANPTGGLWLIGTAQPRTIGQSLRQAGLPLLALAVLCLSLLAQAAEVMGWGILGSGALLTSGGWRTAWVLCLASTVPLGLLQHRAGAAFARHVAQIIRHRLIEGALTVSSPILRADGPAGLLARGLEAQSFEASVTQLALGSLATVAQLVWAVWVLTQGAAPALTIGLLALWLSAQAALGQRFAARLRDWTVVRRDMTAQLVERMVGHRTILAQEDAGRRTRLQDQQLAAYLGASTTMDRASLPFIAAVPLSWMLAGVAALAPSYVAGADATRVAISIGGIFLAGRCLGGVAGMMNAWATARTAWAQIAPLMAATTTPEAAPQFMPLSHLSRQPLAAPILRLSAGTIAHPGRKPVLADEDFSIHPGDHLLLEGPSGAGKSSLIRVLSGHDVLTGGSLTLCGSTGAPHPLHHRIIAATPQFHDNHIFTGSLAFNLLLGRAWPPTAADLTEARQLCDRLGLGPLVQRMPGGMMTQLGETGWQISHGEKSRIYLARSLLQRAQAVVLDESFAALDPHTLQLCLAVAKAEAAALLVVAHP